MASQVTQKVFDSMEKNYLDNHDEDQQAKQGMVELYKKFEEDFGGNTRMFKEVMKWKRLALKNPLRGRLYWDDFKYYMELSKFEEKIAPMLGDQAGAENTSGLTDTTIRRRGRPKGSKNRPKTQPEYSDNVTQFEQSVA